MTQQYDNRNRGTIAKNPRKEKDTHPDIRGQINVDGVEYWLDGWQKQRNDGSGNFYSLSVKRKENQAAAPQRPAPTRQRPPRDDFEDGNPF